MKLYQVSVLDKDISRFRIALKIWVFRKNVIFQEFSACCSAGGNQNRTKMDKVMHLP